MSIANDILSGRMPNIAGYLAAGESIDDIDEYGFTPLIETAIARQPEIAKVLIEHGADVNKTDVTGRGALHWAVDNDDLRLTRLLLDHGADPNAYTRAGLPVLVYPLLRVQNQLKHLLYQYGAKIEFAQDFISAKLLGHRFELCADVDILNAKGEFIELDYSGFILEFSLVMIIDSLRRFTSSYSTRHVRHHFPLVHTIMDAFSVADELLQFQQPMSLTAAHKQRLAYLLQSPLLILPAASRGHAFCFVRYRQWWAKIDRGENSLRAGSINVYQITHPEVLNVDFLQEFLYKKQPMEYFNTVVNQKLGLVHVGKIPMARQISGNCSWANVQAVVPVAYNLLQMSSLDMLNDPEAIKLYESWVEWDKDRALDDCIQRFYAATPERKASLASMLAGVLFQACDDRRRDHLARAEKILTVLTLPAYRYILNTYLDIYCIKQRTIKGNNLLKLLEDCGINPNIGVNPIA